MLTSSYERLLRVCFGSILATATGATVASCSSSPPACGGCGCGGVDAQSQSYNVTYTVCGSADAGAEASSDGGDAGACFYTCAEACAISSHRAWAERRVRLLQHRRGGGADGYGDVRDGLRVSGAAGRRSRCPRRWRLVCQGRVARGRVRSRVLAPRARAGGVRRTRELVARARASARDEARHARIMRKLAKKHGSHVPRLVATDMPVRDSESIARENAVEGCVGETFGALLAAHRAVSDADADIREAMAAIAPDELRHAALGWTVAEWATASSRLTRALACAPRATRQLARWSLGQRTRRSTLSRLR